MPAVSAGLSDYGAELHRARETDRRAADAGT